MVSENKWVNHPNLKIASDILLENHPSPVTPSELASTLDISTASAWEILNCLVKGKVAVKIHRGQYCIANGASVDDLRKNKIRMSHTLRYPFEIWPIQKWVHSLLKGAKFRNDSVYIDELYLQSLWDKQEGLCDLTGVPMTTVRGNGWQVPTNASLDRINSSIGYTEGNVRFVCWQVNVMKHRLTDDELRLFCKLIVTHYSQRSKDETEGYIV